MKFVFAVLLLTGLVGLSNAQTCGLTDSGVHIPPNYTTLAPPAYGHSYTDPLTGCVITRLVNGTHEYSEMSAINSNDTKIIVGLYNGGSGVSAIIDFSGNTICACTGGAGTCGVTGLREPRWDKTDPNKIWYHDNSTNNIYTLNATTCAYTVYDTLSAFTTLQFCGGESDLSADGDHLCVSDASVSTSIRRYTISTKTLGTAIRGGRFGGGGSIDFADITPVNNNILVNFGPGTGGRGFEVYDGATGVFMHEVANVSGHSDRFVAANGHEMIFFGGGSGYGNATCGSDTAFRTLDMSLTDGAPVNCGIDIAQYVGGHFSANNEYTGVPPARQTVAISTDNDKATWPALDPNWQATWTPFTNEIIIQNTDGTGRRRLAQHRAINSVGYYWNQTRASMSRSGNWIVYDSNFGRSSASPDDAFIDVYLLRVNSTGAAPTGPTSPAAPSNVTVTVQ